MTSRTGCPSPVLDGLTGRPAGQRYSTPVCPISLEGTSSSTPDEFCGPSRQGHSRDPRLPRHRHQRASGMPRQTRPRHTSLDSPTPAASHAQSSHAARKSLTRPPDNQCAITRNPGLARLETQPLLNHARQHRWRVQPTAPCTYSILTRTNKGSNRDAPHRERLSQTAPATHKTRPNGPGLTCEFDGGRCWVRTNVG